MESAEDKEKLLFTNILENEEIKGLINEYVILFILFKCEILKDPKLY